MVQFHTRPVGAADRECGCQQQRPNEREGWMHDGYVRGGPSGWIDCDFPIALSWEPKYLLGDCLIFLHPRICAYFHGCVNHNPLIALTSNSLALLLSCHVLPYHISISNYQVERQLRLATVQVSGWSAQLRDYDSHNHTDSGMRKKQEMPWLVSFGYDRTPISSAAYLRLVISKAPEYASKSFVTNLLSHRLH